MDKLKPNHVSIGLKFENLRPIENTGFVRGECKIAYAGKNRNWSNISRGAFDKAEKTLFGIPVVGNWIEDSSEEFGGRFGGHDIILETRGNELILKDNTVPFGFVPQDANPRWVDVTDEDGNSKSYYTSDVILWYERYKNQIDSIINKGSNQSMEIMTTDYEWDASSNYLNINEFYYSALCLLGRNEDDLSKNIEPCFENSEVVVNNFSFNEEFSAKVFELKKAFEGGENVTDKQKLDVNFENEELIKHEEVFLEDVPEENSEEINQEEKAEEFNEEVAEVAEHQNNFELSHDDIRSKIFDILNPRDEGGYREWNYWIMEVFQTYVMVLDENESEKYYRFDYLIGEDDEITLSNKTEMFLVWLTQEEKEELENKDTNFGLLLQEVEELREYKKTKEDEIANEKKGELINDYSLLLTEEEIDIAVADRLEMTYEEIELALSKAFASKSLEQAKSKNTDKKDTAIVFDNKVFEDNKKKNKFAI